MKTPGKGRNRSWQPSSLKIPSAVPAKWLKYLMNIQDSLCQARSGPDLLHEVRRFIGLAAYYIIAGSYVASPPSWRRLPPSAALDPSSTGAK